MYYIVMVALTLASSVASAKVPTDHEKIGTFFRQYNYEVSREEQWLKASHDTYLNLLLKDYKKGVLLQAYFRTSEMDVGEREIRQLNNRLSLKATTARFYLDGDGDLMCEAWYPGRFDRRRFRSFLDAWHDDTKGQFEMISQVLSDGDAPEEEAPPRGPAPVTYEGGVALRGTGTGFFVAEGIVVTNYHVIKGARQLQVSWGQTTVDARVAVKDESNDLALLELTTGGDYPPPLPVGIVRDIAAGEAVLTIGYPLSGILGERPRITDGIVSSETGLDDDPRICQVTVPIQPGNSGGPLLNRYGEVIAVITSSLNDLYILERSSALPQNVNFAIKINYVHNLLQLLPHPRDVVRRRGDSALDPARIMEMSRPSVVHVMNYQ
jgi:S1-C subfamily serine protease